MPTAGARQVSHRVRVGLPFLPLDSFFRLLGGALGPSRIRLVSPLSSSCSSCCALGSRTATATTSSSCSSFSSSSSSSSSSSCLPTRFRAFHLVCLLLLLSALLLGSCGKPVPIYKVVAAKEGFTHVIAEGETLDSIARKYYGDPVLGRAIGEYNGLDLAKPLVPGTTIIVPYDRKEVERISRVQEGSVAYNRGTMLARTGQYEEAMPYLESAVDLDPDNLDAWHNLALAYYKVGLNDKALPIFSRLVKEAPSERSFHYSHGAALKKSRKAKQAVEEFKRALKIDPEYAEAQYALALTYEEMGKTRKAIEAWQRYLEIDPDSLWAEEARVHLDGLMAR